MLSTGLPVSRLVSVAVSMTTPAVIAPSVNTCLLLGTSDVIDAAERMRRYANITAIAADFGTTSEEYLAADLWFSQSPSPDNLYIGRWFNAPASGRLVGAILPPVDQAMVRWQAITDGAFSVTIDAVTPFAPTEISGLDFSTASNLNGVAAIITAALGGGAVAPPPGPQITSLNPSEMQLGAGATRGVRRGRAAGDPEMVWNASMQRFELQSGTTGSASSVSFLSAPTGTGTDISAMLGMTAASSGAYVAAGMATETALSAAARIDALFSALWYALVCPSGDDDDHQQLAAYCEASDPPHYYGVTTADAATLEATSTADLAATLNAYGYNKTAVQFSRSSPYAIMSYLARILTTRWNGQNTMITLMHKRQPGVQPENISYDEADTLEAKGCNVYAPYANGATMIQYGTSASGEFTDTIIGADALAGDVQAAVFNVMYTSPTKVPQTDSGMQSLANAASAVCSVYVGNGYLASGTWNAQGFGTLNAGDLVALGFYIFAPSMLLQSEADRAARKAPLLQIAAKTAGAVHTADVLIYVNQ